MVPAPSTSVYCQIPSPALISHHIFGILIFKDRQVYLHVSFSCHLLSHLKHPEPSEWSDWDDLEDAMEIKLLSLSKPRSGEGD